jgi:hypothetical protein
VLPIAVSRLQILGADKSPASDLVTGHKLPPIAAAAEYFNGISRKRTAGIAAKFGIPGAGTTRSTRLVSRFPLGVRGELICARESISELRRWR